jgi:energy-coupling factor transporter transmembrane protein EcfT
MIVGMTDNGIYIITGTSLLGIHWLFLLAIAFGEEYTKWLLNVICFFVGVAAISAFVRWVNRFNDPRRQKPHPGAP